jgi:rhodanese-related sulfurtransferase
MMNQLIEFATNHWEMASLFVALLAVVIWVEKKGGPNSLSTAEATNMMNNESAVVLDIRPAAEFKTGHITSAINIPSTKLKDQMKTLEIHKSNPIILVCKTGMTSGASAKELQKEGFNVYKMQGGIAEWQGANLPLVTG